jgi:hypothetical protein
VSWWNILSFLTPFTWLTSFNFDSFDKLVYIMNFKMLSVKWIYIHWRLYINYSWLSYS